MRIVYGLLFWSALWMKCLAVIPVPPVKNEADMARHLAHHKIPVCDMENATMYNCYNRLRILSSNMRDITRLVIDERLDAKALSKNGVNYIKKDVPVIEAIAAVSDHYEKWCDNPIEIVLHGGSVYLQVSDKKSSNSLERTARLSCMKINFKNCESWGDIFKELEKNYTVENRQVVKFNFALDAKLLRQKNQFADSMTAFEMMGEMTKSLNEYYPCTLVLRGGEISIERHREFHLRLSMLQLIMKNEFLGEKEQTIEEWNRDVMIFMEVNWVGVNKQRTFKPNSTDRCLLDCLVRIADQQSLALVLKGEAIYFEKSKGEEEVEVSSYLPALYKNIPRFDFENALLESVCSRLQSIVNASSEKTSDVSIKIAKGREEMKKRRMRAYWGKEMNTLFVLAEIGDQMQLGIKFKRAGIEFFDDIKTGK